MQARTTQHRQNWLEVAITSLSESESGGLRIWEVQNSPKPVQLIREIMRCNRLQPVKIPRAGPIAIPIGFTKLMWQLLRRDFGGGNVCNQRTVTGSKSGDTDAVERPITINSGIDFTTMYPKGAIATAAMPISKTILAVLICQAPQQERNSNSPSQNSPSPSQFAASLRPHPNVSGSVGNN